MARSEHLIDNHRGEDSIRSVKFLVQEIVLFKEMIPTKHSTAFELLGF